MPEPRVIKNPNGGLLSVDVTMMHLGLSRCRSVAEDALVKMGRGEAIDTELTLMQIVDEVRRTLYDIQEHEMTDEIGTLATSRSEEYTKPEWARGEHQHE